ncbi:helicase-like protein, partial [Trypanosoma cruzi]
DLRCAYQCCQQDDERVKRAFGNLVEWISALEGLHDPTDQLIDFGSSLLNTFLMELTMASDPGIPFSKLRARLYTLLFTRRTLMRWQPSLSWIGEKPSALCDANNVIPTDTRHLHAMCAREGINYNTGAHQKTAEELPHAAHECWRRQPHPTRHLPPTLTGSAPRRRRSTLYFKLPDEIVGKDDGAYP